MTPTHQVRACAQTSFAELHWAPDKAGSGSAALGVGLSPSLSQQLADTVPGLAVHGSALGVAAMTAARHKRQSRELKARVAVAQPHTTVLQIRYFRGTLGATTASRK